MRDDRFHEGARIFNVSGMEYIFKALLLIAEILLYMITVPNGVCDPEWRNNLKKKLEDLE